jgi:hypothetical protein
MSLKFEHLSGIDFIFETNIESVSGDQVGSLSEVKKISCKCTFNQKCMKLCWEGEETGECQTESKRPWLAVMELFAGQSKVAFSFFWFSRCEEVWVERELTSCWKLIIRERKIPELCGPMSDVVVCTMQCWTSYFYKVTTLLPLLVK